MGHRGRPDRRAHRASIWIAWISAITSSSIPAIFWCISPGSSPSTNRGDQPYPTKRSSSSSRLIRASTAGLAIL
jgi:hypothetical protein